MKKYELTTKKYQKTSKEGVVVAMMYWKYSEALQIKLDWELNMCGSD